MWTYNGKEFTEDDIGESYGYVYLIKNLANNKQYIGKKLFSKAGYKTVKGKRKKVRKPSDWLTYWGSNKQLNEDVKSLGEHNFSREILYLCKSRSECSYLELREQIDRRVLESDQFYNDWIQVRVTKAHIKKTLGNT
jgi:hypothetical protein